MGWSSLVTWRTSSIGCTAATALDPPQPMSTTGSPQPRRRRVREQPDTDQRAALTIERDGAARPRPEKVPSVDCDYREPPPTINMVAHQSWLGIVEMCLRTSNRIQSGFHEPRCYCSSMKERGFLLTQLMGDRCQVDEPPPTCSCRTFGVKLFDCS